MSLCSSCQHYDTDCIIDQINVADCRQFHPKIPPSRGTTHGELMRMHVESESPTHYTAGSIECIDAMRAMAGDEAFIQHCRLTAFKYLWRLGKKDDRIVDAKKAAVYHRWMIETMEGKELSK